MGHAIYKISVAENCNRESVMREISKRAEREGDGYWSSMHWHDELPPFKNRKEAEEWIDAHDMRNYDDHAVRYYDHTQVSITPKIKELQEKHADLTLKIAAYEKEHSIKNLKATYIGCPKCGSKLARNLIRGEKCPLCGEDLRSKTTITTIAGYQGKRKEIAAKIDTEYKKQTAAKRICWLVKYEFHQ